MIKVVIIEDELPAANRLGKMLEQADSEINIVKRLDSIESTVQYLEKADQADLIFMDIQLADGLSFSIFEQIKINIPVIFTTAFDQYTLKAFKVNSIDYLLKPIDEAELKKAIGKYKQLYYKKEIGFSERIQELLQQINTARYKERLLIKKGQQLSYLKTSSLAYCYADGKLCYAVDFDGNKHLVEHTLAHLEEQLMPDKFFRINRHLLVNIDAVSKVHTWLGSRLKLELRPGTTADTVVSRERVNGFKEWLGQ
jgi:DNA-binding LytR/AlgR family response regulator